MCISKGRCQLIKYQIDEVSKECGLTKRTIRYYEDIGLLFPPDRSEGGYRIYSDKHIERLKQIVEAREVLGITLNEIQEFIGIREKVESDIFDIRKTEGGELKYKKLLDFKEVLRQQYHLIDQKMQKINRIKDDTYYYYKRVNEAIKKYEEEKMNDNTKE